MIVESISADWGDAQAMRVIAEMELDAAEDRKLRFKWGPGGKEIIRSLARLEKKALSAAGLRLGKQEGRMDFLDRHVVVTGGTGALGRAVVGEASPGPSFPAPLDQINAEHEGTGWWEGEIVHKKRDGTRVVVTSRWSLQRDKRERPI